MINPPVSFWHNTPCGCVISTPTEECMVDVNGQLMLDASVRMSPAPEIQPDPTRPPIDQVKLAVTRQHGDTKKTYSVTVPAERVEKQFEEVLKDAIPGAVINDKRLGLLTAILARSSDGHEHRMPTYSTTEWMTEEGWFYRGKRITNAPVELVSEKTDEGTGGHLYTLRTPRADGSGHTYVTTDWEGLNNGTYLGAFEEQRLMINNPLQLSMLVRDRFSKLSDTDRKKLLSEHYEQQKKENDAQLRKRFGIQ